MPFENGAWIRWFQRRTSTGPRSWTIPAVHKQTKPRPCGSP